MNSNPGNQEKGHSAAEAHEIETQPTEGTTDQKAEPELIVTDKRRFTTDGEAIEREQDFQRDRRLSRPKPRPKSNNFEPG